MERNIHIFNQNWTQSIHEENLICECELKIRGERKKTEDTYILHYTDDIYLSIDTSNWCNRNLIFYITILIIYESKYFSKAVQLIFFFFFYVKNSIVRFVGD